MPELRRRWTCEGTRKEQMKINSVFNSEDFCVFVERYCHKAAHRSILIDRYCDGLTFAELAYKYNYPERSIKSIVYKYDGIIVKFIKTLEQG